MFRNYHNLDIFDYICAQNRYGNDSGYSIRNLKYMKQYAEEYPDFPFMQVPLAQITWYHHISMLPKVKDA